MLTQPQKFDPISKSQGHKGLAQFSKLGLNLSSLKRLKQSFYLVSVFRPLGFQML